jgi:hypothetical protein
MISDGFSAADLHIPPDYLIFYRKKYNNILNIDCFARLVPCIAYGILRLRLSLNGEASLLYSSVSCCAATAEASSPL